MDTLIQMGCDRVVYIFYDPSINIFYDVDGLEIHYLFELLTPSDIILFKEDNGNNIFVSRRDRKVIIEIVVEE